MPVSRRETVLSRYTYDPLDRQTQCTLLALPVSQRFYCKGRLATEVQEALRTSVFQHDDQLLAQQRWQDGKADVTLLVTDQQRTVLGAQGVTGVHHLAYSPYGHRPFENGLLSLLGFNGERPDPITGHYHLGNGYRQFNPVLMRFNSPDSWSPFGRGGINAYAYCEGDPRNRVDPTGHMWGIGKFLRRLLGKKPKTPKNKTAISKNIAMRTQPTLNQKVTVHAKPSQDISIDIGKFTKKEIDAQAIELQRLEQTKRWNELVLSSHTSQPISQLERRASISLSEDSTFSSHALLPNQYENYLNNALGSATTASTEELLLNHTWLMETPGPSRLAEKTNYTLDKIRKNIDKRIT